MSTRARAKRPQREERRPVYVRVKVEEHEQLVQIAEARGYPHTIASVATELISRGLKEEAPPKEAATTPPRRTSAR